MPTHSQYLYALDVPLLFALVAAHIRASRVFAAPLSARTRLRPHLPFGTLRTLFGSAVELLSCTSRASGGGKVNSFAESVGYSTSTFLQQKITTSDTERNAELQGEGAISSHLSQKTFADDDHVRRYLTSATPYLSFINLQGERTANAGEWKKCENEQRKPTEHPLAD